jgi:sulfur-oxidizing protein SoxY
MRQFATQFRILAGISLFALISVADAQANDRWSELKPNFFSDRVVNEAGNIITMEAPKRAYDAAIVPIVVNAEDDAREIKQVHLIVDKNPLPLAGVFRFSDNNRSAWQSFETRIRINEYTHVRAIAELDDGSLHMASKFVKASGGCSAPAMADLDTSIANAGKMQILLSDITATDRISARFSANERANSEATIKIRHPNNSGMQFDQISRNYIPAFYVHSIVAEMNGEKLLEVETNFSMSENPVVRFQFSQLSDTDSFKVYALDSKNNRYEQTADSVM